MVKIIEDEEFAEREKKRLEEEMQFCDEFETSKYTQLEINWDCNCKTWKSARNTAINMMVKPENTKLFFIAHSNDTVTGRPQLIENNKRKIVLVRKVEKNIKKDKGRDDTIIQYKFLGDLYDKRYDGREMELLALDFWMYRVITLGGKEYYILSAVKLPNEVCDFKGMSIELDDFAEMSRSMRIKSLTNVFLVKEVIPSVKIISKKDMVESTKEKDICEKDWLDFLAYHPLGNFNRFPKPVELLRSAFILAGKNQGYPLHLGVMGIAGTKKTMGHLDTLGYKFSEEPNICEGANSRIKGLIPSFKEVPTNIGFLAKCERIGLVDEIGKMVEFEMAKHQFQTNNTLGELNFLLEHKKRSVSSGNSPECQVQATAKFMFVTNPLGKKSDIYSHVGPIDPTTMSRILWWVQSEEEVKFVMSPEGIVENHAEKFATIPPYTCARVIEREEKCGISCNSIVSLAKVWGEKRDRSYFLSLFDSCYSFLCEIDDLRVHKIVNVITSLTKEPMKSSVWKPRALHHTKLVIDGLCKHRCLFKDYDSSFKANEEDYKLTEEILTLMAKTWDTDFNINSWKQHFN